MNKFSSQNDIVVDLFETKNQWEDNELGILPLAALIPAAASLLPSVLGALGGNKKAAPSQGLDANAVASLMSTAQSSGGISETALRDIVQSLATSIPASVRDQVMQVIRDTQANQGSVQEANTRLQASISTEFMPKIKAMIDALALAQTQRNVTSEHNAIVAEQEYRKNTTDSLNNLNGQILRLQEFIQDNLAGAKVLRNKKAINILGGSNLLDSIG
jgi:hypothetical protein